MSQPTDPSRPVRSAHDIRADFISFFAERAGHTVVPSAPVVPHDDPTLLFTNAGMNQFKDVFLGQGDRPFVRAVDSQKCIRAGGKHNDLEDVGRDTYHHTFFEMLGNWSFGDYFKKEAITWAWTLLTEVWGLPKDRLHVTVFAGSPDDGTEPDQEAHDLWLECTDIDPAHVSRWGAKDNFWEMGATGPCGPCSEIHFDSTPDRSGAALVNQDHPDVIEIWNLVFIQFNRRDDGTLTRLPAQHVDTGMGFERIVRVLQDKSSNYDTDLWTPLFGAITRASGAPPYGASLDDPIDVAYRVIADHLRCLTVAIADGARPGNEGRAYVLRRILRRAVRMVHQSLGVHEPLLHALVPAVADNLGATYPEIRTQLDRIVTVIREEEEAFLRTLERGLELFNAAAAEAEAGRISADAAFTLHDTFGFPIDLTELMSRERGLGLDRAGYDQLMEAARARSRAQSGATTTMTLPADAIAALTDDGVAPTDDRSKFGGADLETSLVAIWTGRDFVDELSPGRAAGLILAATPFYAEQGGQVGDTGELEICGSTFTVTQTRRFGDFVLHEGTAPAPISPAPVTARIDDRRRRGIEGNHTGTHLLNHALRTVLGEEIDQKGSLVAADRLRFDFSHPSGPTATEIERIEKIVTEAIERRLEVFTADVPLATAQTFNGVRAVFGERYPDPVRVVSIGVPVSDLVDDPASESWPEYSLEFCGGSHAAHAGLLSGFVIMQEQALAAGIRRITAVTGSAAAAATQAGERLRDKVREAADHDGATLIDLVETILRELEDGSVGLRDRMAIRGDLDDLQKKVKAARKAAAKSTRSEAVSLAQSVAEAPQDDVIAVLLEGVSDRDDLLAAMDAIRARHEHAACLLLGTNPEAGKVVMVARVPSSLIDRGLKAGDWVKHVAGLCGGGGGGRPDMAQAGGSRPDQASEAVEAARSWARETLA